MPHARRLTGTLCPAVGSGHSELQKSKEEAHCMDLRTTGELVTVLVEMDNGGPAAHGGHGLEPGKL